MRRLIWKLRWRHRRQLRIAAGKRGDGHLSYSSSVPMLGRACPMNPRCQGTCNRSGACTYCGMAYCEGQTVLRSDYPELFKILQVWA